MTTTLTRGLLAGAAGTAVLDALGHLDLAVRGRTGGDVARRTVDAMGDALGVTAAVPADVRQARHAAIAGLGRIGHGLSVGVLASAAWHWGLRPGRAAGTLTAAAAALAAADVPPAVMGVTDLRDRTAAQWLAHAVPNLGYGLVVDAVLRRDPAPEDGYRAGPAPASLVLRSALLGVAAGCRSTLGVAAPVLLTRRGAGLPPLLTGRAAGTLTTAALATELVGDKLPQTPSRLQPPVLAVRLASGAAGAVALARRESALPAGPAVAGLLGATAGALGGFGWRQWADRRLPDWQAALAEDAVALLLTLAAALPGRAAAPGGAGARGAAAGEAGGPAPRTGAPLAEPPGPVAAGTSSGGQAAAPLRRYRPSPGTFPGLRPYRSSRRRPGRPPA